MYTRFFGLNDKPFSITPDPRYLFMSARHGEALAHLVYGVTESGGFIQLTGEVGTGKTTLVRSLLQNRMPGNADVAVVLNPQLTAREFLATICEELNIAIPPTIDSNKALTDALNHHLLSAHAEGRRTILVVDEAQNLAPDVLEQVRLLTNLETAKQKLLQIILIGQPELRELLARNDLRQLAQRITGRYHLEPLTNEETEQYIDHRLRVAGALNEIFDRGAKKAVFRLSQGVPRLINVICDRALLGAYALESRQVTRTLVRRAADEVSGEKRAPRFGKGIATATGVLVLAAVTFFAVSERGIFQTGKPQTIATTALPAPDEYLAPATAVRLDAANPTANEIVADPYATTALDPKLAEPVLESLDEQLQLAGELTNVEYALFELFRVWGLEFVSNNGSGCQQAEDAGLSCHSQRGSFSSLRQLDRPAILNLVDSKGNPHNVVLLSVDGDYVKLSIGGVAVRHTAASLTDLWFGQSLMLWRPPSSTVVALAKGARGQDVLWLRRSLAAINERYATSELNNDQFESGLETAVRQFQKDQRLDIDGLVGRQTQIIINSLLAAPGTPRLSDSGAQ